MYIVRYRTYGPWQTEHYPVHSEAFAAAVHFAKTYTDVVLDEHREVLRWRNGTEIGREVPG